MLNNVFKPSCGNLPSSYVALRWVSPHCPGVTLQALHKLSWSDSEKQLNGTHNATPLGGRDTW